MQNRAIAHLDLDSFFVSVERLRDSRLEGKPVIVGGNSDRGVVAACSYETRLFGVRSAMPMKVARQLCPDAIILRGDFEAYSQYSSMVTQIMVDNAPVVEKASIDEFYLDMTGMEKFFGTWKFVKELRTKVTKETGLSISLGLSGNKTISKMATNEAKPAGQLQISQGQEQAFLAPLSVSKIPLCGKVTTQTLRNMGITNIGVLSKIPLKMLEKTFGKLGTMLWERANGIDTSPIVPYHDPKSASKEITFEKDTTDVDFLRRVLLKLVEELCYELRKSGFCACCITVKIRYSDFNTFTKQLSIQMSASDRVMTKHALELFDKLYERRLLIRLIGVRFSKLVRGTQQLNLFDDEAKLAPLYYAMDRIRDRYGTDAIGRALNIDLNTRNASLMQNNVP
ncbi:MAG: DNA polymerase IV [Arcicella sp.]|nr:DNA polymerase IV [Arcicella sp.]